MATIENLNSTNLSSNEAGVERFSLTEDDEMLEAIQSRTARSIIAELQANPASATELADRIDTSLQNISYHLKRLDNVDLVTVVGTRYSEKGRKIKIYALAVSELIIHT